MSRSPLLRRATALIVGLALAAPAVTASAGGAGADEPVTLVPVGGGYETDTLEGFARVAADGASGPVVDLVVVPAAYGDAPKDRAENLVLAQQRTDQLVAACTAALAPAMTCSGRLVPLLTRADALDPAASAPLADPATDGIYVLGGDQGLAMQVLADTPAERAMTAAVARGAALGGTSAGAAVESRSMINGYVGPLGPEDGLRRDSTLMWWGDDGDLERGLTFGSTRTILDQHFHQRGRLGRTLSTLASADERFGGTSPVGVGVDYGTGARLTGDTVLDGVFGQGSVSLVDLETLGATHTWKGSPATLSTRRVLTHLQTPGDSYDLVTRTLTHDGVALPDPLGTPWSAPTTPGSGTLLLGGGVLGTPVLGDVVARARAVDASKTARLVVLAAGTGSGSLASSYAQATKKAGWAGKVTTSTWSAKGWDASVLRGVTAVLLVADDPASLAPAAADARFRDAVAAAVRTTPVVLADGAMSAFVGLRWSATPRPTTTAEREDAGIAAFRADDAAWRAGLGLVDATVVPRLATDVRWGRLYSAVDVDRTHLALGVLDGSAVVLAPSGASVVGASVVVADGDEARTWTAPSGALGAADVVLDVLAGGEALEP